MLQQLSAYCFVYIVFYIRDTCSNFLGIIFLDRTVIPFRLCIVPIMSILQEKVCNNDNLLLEIIINCNILNIRILGSIQNIIHW